MNKFTKRFLYAILAGIIIFIIVYAWPRVPIITAFTAKGMCSSVFIAEKDPERVEAEDLSFFPINLAKTKIDYDERSVTATVFGLAKRKAVFRDGLGSVLVLETPQEELLAARFDIPDPGYRQDTLPWPQGDVLPASLPPGVDCNRLVSILEEALDPPGAKPFKKTLSLAVVYGGDLVGEKYLDGYDPDTKFHGWSMTKSLTGALVGVLVGEGRMDITARVDIPEWSGDIRAGITLEDLLHMNSGLDWLENYFTVSEATLMLMQRDNMFEYVVSRSREFPPGTNWKYSSGDAILVSGLIRKAAGNDDTYHSLPYSRLLHRIGMLNTLIETDAAGNFVASSYSYGTTRDWARFGLLCLNEGVFAGDTVLPPGWIDYLHTPAPNSDGVYAGMFWLQEYNAGEPDLLLPFDYFSANGFLGQRIFIVPSKKLVVVRTGYGSRNFSFKDLLTDIISTLPE
jgi:CubicO group peptidase (beta-lactamase class C family)